MKGTKGFVGQSILLQGDWTNNSGGWARFDLLEKSIVTHVDSRVLSTEKLDLLLIVQAPIIL